VRCTYHPDYFLPLPEGHPFPMEKFPQAHDLLKTEVEIIEAPHASREDLERVHHPDYLDRVNDGLSADERKRLGLPANPRLLERSALETGGTLLAAQAAMADGVAANLAGGTHHAYPDRGLGYCVLNDVAVTILRLQQAHPDWTFLVADTDAHQGNGTHFIFRNDPRVITYSIHVGKNYPSRKEAGDLDVPLPRWVDGGTYIRALKRTLPPLFETNEPDLVFWISGADCHQDDRFGQMKLSTNALAERDHFVLQCCLQYACPTVVLYGGGYNRRPGMTAQLHAQSIRIANALFHPTPLPESLPDKKNPRRVHLRGH
jgi:acetoin utilization deacetylase AcuC-like enzyme